MLTNKLAHKFTVHVSACVKDQNTFRGYSHFGLACVKSSHNSPSMYWNFKIVLDYALR